MTGFTCVHSEGGDVAVVAVIASERRAIRHALMGGQGEPDGLVWEQAAVHFGERRVSATMFDVTIPAGQARTVVHKPSVQ